MTMRGTKERTSRFHDEKKVKWEKIRGVPNCRGRRRSVQKEIGKERKKYNTKGIS